jgi:hypothetical protein
MQKALVNKHWQCIRALGKTRSVTSARLYLTTSTAQPWCHMAMVLRHHRWLKWTTMRILTHGTKRQRMALRVRDTLGYLRSGGQVQWVCSEPRKRPDGRRKY